MIMSPFDDWIGIYDDEISKEWYKERQELKTVAMLIHAVKKEFAKLTNNFDKELVNIKNKLSTKDNLTNSGTSQSYTKSTALENQKVSPDLFRNQHLKSADTSLDSKSSIDEGKTIENSPTIKRKKRDHYSKVKKDVETAKRNISHEQNLSEHDDSLDTILDASIVEDKPKRKKSVPKKELFITRKKRKSKTANSTLTQMFLNAKSTADQTTILNIGSNTFDSDITILTNENKSKNSNLSNDCPPTMCPEQGSASSQGRSLDINKLLAHVNASDIDSDSEAKDLKNTANDCSPIVLSSLDSISESQNRSLDINELIAKINNVPVQLEEESVIRGNARKNLPGWACKQCENFYKNQGLTHKELLERMKACSKHRSKFMPREETAAGFWDITVRSPSQEL